MVTHALMTPELNIIPMSILKSKDVLDGFVVVKNNSWVGLNMKNNTIAWKFFLSSRMKDT